VDADVDVFSENDQNLFDPGEFWSCLQLASASVWFCQIFITVYVSATKSISDFNWYISLIVQILIEMNNMMQGWTLLAISDSLFNLLSVIIVFMN
jgi:hypothetical protein